MTAITCPECGCIHDTKPKGKPRSNPQLRRFFAVVRAAFDNWPETHRFQPKNPEHLRAWLEVEAGHFTVGKTIRCDSADPIATTAMLTAVLQTSDDDKIFVELNGNRVVVKKAVSISFSQLNHLGACALFDQIDDVLKAEGFDPEKLLVEAEAA